MEETASGFSFPGQFYAEAELCSYSISVPGSKQFSSKCSLQRTEFPMGFHFARVRCTCFIHFSLMLGSLGNLKILTRSLCVLEHAAATQRVGTMLVLSFPWWRKWNHTHKGIWICTQIGSEKGESLSQGFEETRVKRDLKFFVGLVWPKFGFKKIKTIFFHVHFPLNSTFPAVKYTVSSFFLATLLPPKANNLMYCNVVILWRG